MSNKIYFKIHPAIGVAHLGTCEESVEFFDQLTKFQQACGDLDAEMKVYQSFKTEDKLHFKKQAVQFSVFAYDESGTLLYKVADKNIEWDIKISNRKLHNYSKKSQNKFYLPEISGTINKSEIKGKNPWTGKEEIELGEFSNGTFNPPVSKLYNREGLVKDDELKDGSIDQYPADASHDPVTKNDLKLSYTDNTSDGIISATINFEEDGIKKSEKAEPAWLVVAPPKSNVFFTPAEAEEIKNKGRNFFPLENTNYNLDFINKTFELLNIQSISNTQSDSKIQSIFKSIECNCKDCQTSEVKKKIDQNREDTVNSIHLFKSNYFCINNPNHLDYFMMSTINGDYDPGMEICLSGDPNRNEDNFDIQHAFMKPGVRNIQSNEIRVKPFDEQVNKGTKPGQLTSGLCSTWQGDLIACLNFWTAENPLMAYENSIADKKKLQKQKGKIIMHKDKDENNRFDYAEEIVKHIGKRPLVYHEYDAEGNVYFIKVDDTEPKQKLKNN